MKEKIYLKDPYNKMTTLFELAALTCPEVNFREYVGNIPFLLEYIKHLREVSKNGWLIKDVPDEYKTHGLYLAAVSNDGGVLSLIPDEHKDYNLCLKAVNQNGLAIVNVPDKFYTDELKCTAKKSLNYTGDVDDDDEEFFYYVYGELEELAYEMELEKSIDRMTGDLEDENQGGFDELLYETDSEEYDREGDD